MRLKVGDRVRRLFAGDHGCVTEITTDLTVAVQWDAAPSGMIGNCPALQLVTVGDLVRCNLVSLSMVYGATARVTDLSRPDQGIMVAFNPITPGCKPYRTRLDDRSWELVDDVVTLLGEIVS